MNRRTKTISGSIFGNILSILLLLSSLLLFTGCDDIYVNNVEHWEVSEPMISREKVGYADEMRFRFQVVINGERETRAAFGILLLIDPQFIFDPEYLTFDPSFTELIFVHNEEEAQGFPDNVITAWPREGNWTQGLLYGINWAVGRDENDLYNIGRQMRPVVTFEQFGLFYPITIEDLVDNWEKVNALWRSLSSSERSFIHRAAPYGGPYDEPVTANE